jgi:UDP-N-acetylmuramate dehydrogenase
MRRRTGGKAANPEAEMIMHANRLEVLNFERNEWSKISMAAEKNKNSALSAPEKMKKFVRRLLREFPDISRRDENLVPFTSYKVGGIADVMVTPKTIDQLEQVVRMCIKEGVSYFVMGKGANILVHDDGFRGVVILLEKCCSKLFHQDNLLYVGAGATVTELVEYCEKHGLKGLDYMSGIPGTAGGALRMNAGAFVGEIGDRVLRINALNEKGYRIQLTREEAQFGYRRAEGLEGKILLGCWLFLEPGDPGKLSKAREEYLKRRAKKQPLEYPSCGSVFKRPPGDYAGRLIEAANCKGFTVGGAMVSEKHANLVVNFKDATASDIYEVIWRVQRKVFEHCRVWLQLEVKLVGFSEEEQQRVAEAPDEQEKKTN